MAILQDYRDLIAIARLTNTLTAIVSPFTNQPYPKLHLVAFEPVPIDNDVVIVYLTVNKQDIVSDFVRRSHTQTFPNDRFKVCSIRNLSLQWAISDYNYAGVRHIVCLIFLLAV